MIRKTKVKKSLSALKIGQSVENPELWKKVQSIANIMATVIGLTGTTLSEGAVNNISLGITIVLVGGYNIYLTLATSNKVGL